MNPIPLDVAAWLTTPSGLEGVNYATRLPLDEQQRIRTLTLLQLDYTREMSFALLDQARLRIQARMKFGEFADSMLFTDEALQQASGRFIARYRAQRYAAMGAVADLGCGIGGDSIALRHGVPSLVALDLDPLRVIFARHNLGLVEGGTAKVIEADWTKYEFPADMEAAFADPARRVEEKRVFSLHQMIPPLSEILRVQKRLPHLGVKVMPGVADEELPPDGEAEWISEGGTAKEGVLWFGGLRRGVARTATIVEGEHTYSLTSADPAPSLEVTPPRRYLYEPDPAVIRATLVAQAAFALGASQLDEQIAYLTGDSLTLTPFVRGWEVITHAPFNLKHLNRTIQELGANVITVKKRGSPIEPETFRKRLKSIPKGRPVTLFVTRHRDMPYMVICGEEIKE